MANLAYSELVPTTPVIDLKSNGWGNIMGDGLRDIHQALLHDQRAEVLPDDGSLVALTVVHNDHLAEELIRTQMHAVAVVERGGYYVGVIASHELMPGDARCDGGFCESAVYRFDATEKGPAKVLAAYPGWCSERRLAAQIGSAAALMRGEGRGTDPLADRCAAIVASTLFTHGHIFLDERFQGLFSRAVAKGFGFCEQGLW